MVLRKMSAIMSIVKKIAEEELEPAAQLDELDNVDDYYAACAEKLYAKAKNPVNVSLTQRFDQLSISTILNNVIRNGFGVGDKRRRVER